MSSSRVVDGELISYAAIGVWYNPRQRLRHLKLENAPSIAALERISVSLCIRPWGEYGTESVCLAAMPDRILWTDDLIQAQLGAQEFGINRVWTQLLLENLASEGALSLDDYSRATALLVGMNYLVTLFNPDSIVAAFKATNWSPEDFPASHFRKVLSEVPEGAFVRLFLDVIRTLFGEALLLPEKRCIVVSCLIDLFADRPNGETRLAALGKLAVRMFGLNLVGATEFQRCFDRWMKLRQEPIIVIPD